MWIHMKTLLFGNNDLPEPWAAEVHVHWCSMQWISDPVEQVVTVQSLVSLQFSAATVKIKDNSYLHNFTQLIKTKIYFVVDIPVEKNAFKLLETSKLS